MSTGLEELIDADYILKFNFKNRLTTYEHHSIIFYSVK